MTLSSRRFHGVRAGYGSRDFDTRLRRWMWRITSYYMSFSLMNRRKNARNSACSNVGTSKLPVSANVSPKGRPAKNVIAANCQFQSVICSPPAPLGTWANPNTAEEINTIKTTLLREFWRAPWTIPLKIISSGTANNTAYTTLQILSENVGCRHSI